MKKRYILTGTPGSGKTTIARELERTGYSVIAEAATDIVADELSKGITESWKHVSFIDNILALQKQRQQKADKETAEVQFFDRSPVCTLALATYLGHSPSDALSEELARIRSESIYENEVFFVDNLGTVEHTTVRTISYPDALRFEEIHLQTYESLGYKCIRVPANSVAKRVAQVIQHVS